MLRNTPLKELRQAKHISQTELAALLSTKQVKISRIERRADIHISTLRRYIEVMGGKLDIIARFPDGDDVHIDQFRSIGVKSSRNLTFPRRVIIGNV